MPGGANAQEQATIMGCISSSVISLYSSGFYDVLAFLKRLGY